MAQPNWNSAEKMDGHMDGDIKRQADRIREQDSSCVAHSLRRDDDEDAEDLVSSSLIAIQASSL